MTRDVLMAVARAEAFLVAAQEPDGLWRDYSLLPGPGEAWITGVVGSALVAAPVNAAHRARLDGACHALDDVRMGGGWGYNRYTSTDADSTAWCLRFLCAMQQASGPAAWQPLAAFLDAQGQAHTMALAAAGTWAKAHADVTPVVGLALLAAGAPVALLRCVREGVLRGRDGATWRSFWWSTDLYATARSLEFLHAFGGVPDDIRVEYNRLRLADEAAGAAAFELAQAISIALLLQRPADAAVLGEFLLATQRSDGGWPASAMLALPSHDERVDETPTFPDEERLMTTSMALAALKQLVQAGRIDRALGAERDQQRSRAIHPVRDSFCSSPS